MMDNRVSLNIGLVDNDAITLQSLAMLLQRMMPQMRISWTASTGRRAIEAGIDPVLKTDVMLLDMSLEDMSGVAVCREIRRRSSEFPILGMTSFSLNSYAESLFQAGAQGIVGKIDVAEICKAMLQVASGQVLQYESSHRAVIFETAQVAHSRLSRAAVNGEVATLSSRERQTVELCSKGLSLSEVAQEMNVSVETVKTNLKRAERRTGTTSKDQLLALWWGQR